MAAVQIAAAGTVNGTTAGVVVTEARCYDFHIHWDQVGPGPSITPQFSVDGTNYFAVGAPTNLSQTASEIVYRYTDMPVTKMRLVVSGLTGGTVSAYVSAV